MQRRTLTFGLATVLALGIPVLAHEGHEHKLMGKVASVDAQRIEIETKDGTKVAALLTPETKYLRGKAAAAFADVQVGARVVIAVVEQKVGEKPVKKVTQVLLGELPAASPRAH